MADEELEEARRIEMRKAEMDAYRKALDIDANDSELWNALSAGYVKQGRESASSNCLVEGLAAARTAVRLGGAHYNLACALAVLGQLDEALQELERSLAANEVTQQFVVVDPDWESLLDNPRFRTLVEVHHRLPNS